MGCFSNEWDVSFQKLAFLFSSVSFPGITFPKKVNSYSEDYLVYIK